MSNFQFDSVPVIKHSRSRFDLSHSVKTSANVGSLYPFDVQEVYAGDTLKVDTACVSRLSTQFIRPIMDNLFLDIYYFFVPSRLLYDKFVNIFGENTESAWANTVEYSVPAISMSTSDRVSNRVHPGSVADYLGLPVAVTPPAGTGSGYFNVSVLPFRAFAKIYNEWFRDQNNVPPMHIQTGAISASESLNAGPWTPSNYTGMPPKVSKFHDLFTSALPSPQKGNAVDLPIGNFIDVPVIAKNLDVGNASLSNVGMQMGLIGTGGTPSSGYPYLTLSGKVLTSSDLTVEDNALSGDQLAPDNLFAKTSQLNAAPVSVNDLRFAFQYQRMLERDARGGSRYVEYLQSHFGVSAGDYRLQRSEFLGGRRTPISIHQVTQTTGEGSDSSPLGAVGAWSLSSSRSRFTKGFTENGYVIGVFCLRQFHTYQQGIEKFWSRFKRSDFYDPVFAHIGEQPIYTKQLYARPGVAEDTVFGYGEAWVDLRYRENRVTGQMRTGVPNSLDVWHLADYYSNNPVLGQSFIEETPSNVNRVITVDSSQQDQFILDFYIKNIAYRPLPTYSVPGLVDHD